MGSVYTALENQGSLPGEPFSVDGGERAGSQQVEKGRKMQFTWKRSMHGTAEKHLLCSDACMDMSRVKAPMVFEAGSYRGPHAEPGVQLPQQGKESPNSKELCLQQGNDWNICFRATRDIHFL